MYKIYYNELLTCIFVLLMILLAEDTVSQTLVHDLFQANANLNQIIFLLVSAKMYRHGHPNVEFQLPMLLMKNPQI